MNKHGALFKYKAKEKQIAEAQHDIIFFSNSDLNFFVAKTCFYDDC